VGKLGPEVLPHPPYSSDLAPSDYPLFGPMKNMGRNLHLILICKQLKGSMKEPNKFHIYETEKITRKASDSSEYIELFGSFTQDRHAQRI